MAATLTSQHSPFPSSGNTLTRDGSPLHTRLGKDLMLGCNNLGYTFPFVGSAFKAGGVYSENFGEATDEEYLSAQVPTVLPSDGFRFCFTLGLTAETSGGIEDAELTSIKLYLSGAPYTGVDEAVFDPTAMGSPYSEIEVAVGVTVASGVPQYVFVDHSAGTAGNWLPFKGTTTGGLVNANLIVTSVGHMDELEPYLTIYLNDFTWWIAPE